MDFFFKSLVTNPVKAQFPAAQNRPGASGPEHKLVAQTHTHTTRLFRALVSGINLPITYICEKPLEKTHKQQKQDTFYISSAERQNIVRQPTEVGRPVREKKN